MNENIDTSKTLTIYQSKLSLIVLLLFYFCFGLVFVYLPIEIKHNLNQNTWLTIVGAFVILSIFFIYTLRQFFIKTPLLQVNNEGFFTRKTGKVSWNEISDINMFGTVPLGTSSAITIVFKNGKKVNINTNSMRLPNESAFNPNRGLGVFEVMQTYRRARGL